MAPTHTELNHHRCDVELRSAYRLNTICRQKRHHGHYYANSIYVLPQSAIAELRRCGCVLDTHGAPYRFILRVLPTVVCCRYCYTAYLPQGDTYTYTQQMALIPCGLYRESGDGVYRCAIRYTAIYALLLPAMQQLFPADQPNRHILGVGNYDVGISYTDYRVDSGTGRNNCRRRKMVRVGFKYDYRMDRIVTRSGDSNLMNSE